MLPSSPQSLLHLQVSTAGGIQDYRAKNELPSGAIHLSSAERKHYLRSRLLRLLICDDDEHLRERHHLTVLLHLHGFMVDYSR